VKNLKKREKRKEKEAAEDRGELESELKRRDKKIEDLKVGASLLYICIYIHKNNNDNNDEK